MTAVVTNRAQAEQADHHEEGLLFHCSRCEQDKPVPGEGGTGYAIDESGVLICYQCCADLDRQYMIEHGRITLYLICEPAHYAKKPQGRKTTGEVTNWPGTLRFPCHTRTGKHNIAGVRYDVWFRGPDGYEWYGVAYGDNTQICHCRRTNNKL